MKTIDAREDYSLIEEYKRLIVNDNCSMSDGVEVWLDREKNAKRLSVYTSILGYENKVYSVGEDWVLKVDVGTCICPVSL